MFNKFTELFTGGRGGEAAKPVEGSLGQARSKLEKPRPVTETEESRGFAELLSALKRNELEQAGDGTTPLKIFPLTEALTMVWGGEKNVSPRLCELFQRARIRLRELASAGTQKFEADRIVMDEMMAQFTPTDIKSIQQAAREDQLRQQRLNGGLGNLLPPQSLVQDVFARYMYWRIAEDKKVAAASTKSVDKAA